MNCNVFFVSEINLSILRHWTRLEIIILEIDNMIICADFILSAE